MAENNPTKIIYCGCENDYQDKKYGKNMRVHNPCSESSKPIGHRCTVCGIVK